MSRRGAALAAAVLAALLPGCTTLRIVRYQDPASDRPRTIFAQRLAHASARPAAFAVAAPPRSDLDSVRVRDVDGAMRPLAEYLRRRHVRAFLVVRHDTLLYERYAEGYGPATSSCSFSVAKSVTSALLGCALRSGAIRSLDDSVTRYLPELSHRPAFRGVTLRDLLGMRSGLAYTRTNGHLWHDLRSSDARFFYTTNRERELARQRREEAPGLRWAYKDSDADLLGWILERATGRPVAAQLESEIWQPMGAEHDASWDLDRRNGLEDTGAGLNATARDFARLGGLYLAERERRGPEIVPYDWVDASTRLDTTRTEPEVATWWQMQHQHDWWIPMQNWSAERDFFADGSRGQRIYVSPRAGVVIVQLANDSAQDFPFRALVHHLLGEPYRFPTLVSARLASAARAGAGADSIRRLYAELAASARTSPADFAVNEAGLVSTGERLHHEPVTSAAGLAVLEIAVDRVPDSWRAHEALGEALEREGSRERAAAEYREATRLAPSLAKFSAKRLATLAPAAGGR